LNQWITDAYMRLVVDVAGSVVYCMHLCVEDELVRVKQLYQSLHQEMLPGYPHEISAM